MDTPEYDLCYSTKLSCWHYTLQQLCTFKPNICLLVETSSTTYKNNNLTVRELMGRVRNVALMNVYLGLENPGGVGISGGGYMSQVREMGKLVYEQPGNEVDGSCHSKEGSK